MRKEVIALLLAAGCGHAQVIRVEPEIRPDVRPLPTVDLSDVNDEQFKPDPMPMVDKAIRDRAADLAWAKSGKEPASKAKPAGEAGATKEDPRLLVAKAQNEATMVPRKGDCVGGVCKYRFRKGDTYLVYGCHNATVLIELAPGEHFNDKDDRPSIAEGWRHNVVESGDGHGNIVDVVTLLQDTSDPKPELAWFTTNVATYLLQLEAAAPGETRCMRGLQFVHEQRELRRLIRDAEMREDAQSSGGEAAAPAPTSLSAQYTIEVLP